MPTKQRARRNRIPYTPEARHQVKTLHKQSRWGDVAIKSQIVAKELPGHDRVTAGMVSSILYKDTLKTVDPEVLASVLQVLRSLPPDSDQASRYDKSASRITLEPDLVSALSTALDQSNLSAAYLLKVHHAPEGLGTGTLHKIRSGKQQSIRVSHRDFLEGLIEALNKA